MDGTGIDSNNSAIFEGIVTLLIVDEKIFEQDNSEGSQTLLINEFLLPQPGEEAKHCGCVVPCRVVKVAAVSHQENAFFLLVFDELLEGHSVQFAIEHHELGKDQLLSSLANGFGELRFLLTRKNLFELVPLLDCVV